MPAIGTVGTQDAQLEATRAVQLRVGFTHCMIWPVIRSRFRAGYNTGLPLTPADAGLPLVSWKRRASGSVTSPLYKFNHIHVGASAKLDLPQSRHDRSRAIAKSLNPSLPSRSDSESFRLPILLRLVTSHGTQAPSPSPSRQTLAQAAGLEMMQKS
jgi:hypothetical protein